MYNVYIRQEKFEQVTVHCQRFADLIPVTFVLGFYVRCVGVRWGEMSRVSDIGVVLQYCHHEVVGPVQDHTLAGLLLPLHLHLHPRP